MHGVAWRGMWICVHSKNAQKQLARTSLNALIWNYFLNIISFTGCLIVNKMLVQNARIKRKKTSEMFLISAKFQIFLYKSR